VKQDKNFFLYKAGRCRGSSGNDPHSKGGEVIPHNRPCLRDRLRSKASLRPLHRQVPANRCLDYIGWRNNWGGIYPLCKAHTLQDWPTRVKVITRRQRDNYGEWQIKVSLCNWFCCLRLSNMITCGGPASWHWPSLGRTQCKVSSWDSMSVWDKTHS
jgi:hypothetical protein